MRHIEIMDTTLRDGEQTSGVSFSASEKLTIAQLLLTELKVDRIEIASARVSEGEFQAVKKITSWASKAGYLDRVEVLTFVDGGTSVQWMLDAGAKVMNLLTKGSLNHLQHQLKKTPEQHFSEIRETIEGKYGRFLSEASFCISKNSKIVAACLITLWKNQPLIAFSMTCLACRIVA
jgi:D-citramalate synthase